MGNLFSIPISANDTVFSPCWDYILGQVSYTGKLEENLKALIVELKKLKAQRDDVKQAVHVAEEQLMKQLSQVQVWLSRVHTVVAEADELIEASPQEIQRLCFAGCFSKDFNYMSSYRFGKQVAQKLQEIVDLKNEGVFERVAEYEPAPLVDVRPTEPTVGLESTLIRVWRLLKVNDVGIIGLHGLGGVGKTTLLTQINNKLSNDLLGFDVVIWVLVSKDHSIEKVQEKICEKVGLSSELWMNKSSDDKAVLIFRVLSRKKFVLLMDDVWEWLDLIKVGIPTPNQENGCKLIFTTRFLEVCGQMGAHVKIKVECLGAEDAWKLFVLKIGEENLDSHIRKLAKQVAAKCGGLPLALITVGRAMACKNTLQDWKYAIEVLKEFPHKLARMDQEVYSLLKFGYDSLPNDTIRSCLLYCSLYSDDCIIAKVFLIDRWFCEGFLDEFGDLSRARIQGYNIINCLLNACLLEPYEGRGDFVKMHDVIHDMALWIAGDCEAPKKKYFVRARGGVESIETVLDIENWTGVRVSLANNRIDELRGTPTCPNLQTLFIKGNKLKVISNGFFQFMHNLRVLNLSLNWKLRVLPESISYLVSLECLDLIWTGIIELPINMNRLSKLKCLNLAVTPYLKKIPQKLICNLLRLQIFRISISDEDVDKVDGDNVLSGGKQGLIEELQCLEHLDSLVIEIKNASTLQQFLSSYKLLRCTEQLWLSGFRESKELNVLPFVNMERLEALVISGCQSIEEIKVKIQTSLFPSTPRFQSLSTVFISKCDKLRDITWLILAPNLTWLSVVFCSKMEKLLSEDKLSEVVAAVGIQYSNPFAKLESLYLGDLPELKNIHWDSLSFPCLRQIKVFNCLKLKKLPLNLHSAKGNQISIEGYQEWWDEVEWEDEATRIAFLPSFKCAYWWKDINWEGRTCPTPPLFLLYGNDYKGQRKFEKITFIQKSQLSTT